MRQISIIFDTISYYDDIQYSKRRGHVEVYSLLINHTYSNIIINELIQTNV